jgi:acetylornithine deacetylase/succinyl-diaminopimelate desuccinylase-like protein
MTVCKLTCVLGMALICIGPEAVAAEMLPPQLQFFQQIYNELVEIDTTDSDGDTLHAAQAIAARLRAGGIPVGDIQVISTAPRRSNVMARLRGTRARRPILLLAHIDVVPARREDWDYDPFKLMEINGYFHGRGVIDDKAMAAIFVANMIEYVKEGFKPDRDIILALTTDEELARSPNNGIRWLLQHRRELIDAEFASKQALYRLIKELSAP